MMPYLPVRCGAGLLSLATAVVLAAGLAAGDFPPVVNSQRPQDRPPSPQEAAAAITVPDGFRVTLFAGEPDVAQPIALDFDDRGRLWVVECYTYDGGGFTDQFRDRILIFADEDQDGRFGTRKVFWDQGQRVTGLTLGFGSAWVLADGRLLRMPYDGEDRPGEPVVLLDGFDRDRVGHNVVSGLLWGPDGWLYGRHGIQATSAVGPPGAPEQQRVKLNCSIWRFHPTRHEFQVVTQGTTNPWGLDYDDHGELFFTNNVNGHLWHAVPGAHFVRMYGEDFDPHLYALMDQCADHYHWDTGQPWTASRDAVGRHGELGGGHAHCGGMIYLGDNWPAEYRNSMFTCNVHGRRINRDLLQRHGCSYAGRHAHDFLLANQPWFRGVELKCGPDGGVFVTDWSDLGECHDHDGVHRTSGRIYKVVYGKTTAPGPLDLAELDDAELVQLQLHANDWYVRRARRLLQERAEAGRVLSAAHRQLRDIFDSHPDVTRRLRALWALYSSGGADDDFLARQLEHPHESVRVWAIRLLVEQPPPPGAVLIRFAEMAAEDGSGLVRLYLASALQRLPAAERWPIAAGLARRSEDAGDRHLPLMLWYGIEGAVPQQPEHALRLVASTRIPLLRIHIARRLAGDLERASDPVDRLLRLADSSGDAAVSRDVLDGMAAAVRGWRRATPPPAWPAVHARLARHPDRQVQSRIRELALVFGDGGAMEQLLAVARNPSEPAESRRRALAVLVENRPPDLAPTLLSLAREEPTAVEAIRGLAAYDHAGAARVVLEQMPGLDADGRREAVSTLSSRPRYARALLQAVGRGQLPATEITAFHARQLASLSDAEVDRLLAQHWGEIRQTAEDKAQAIAAYKVRLTDEALERADPSRGRLLFQQTCGTCHALFGEGAKIGPDLTGSNRDNLDYLLENIIDPSAVVPHDFRLSTILLEDGRVISGVIGLQTERTIHVQTQDQLLVLDREDVAQTKPSALSLMPDGLLTPLSPDQVRDLIGYLQSASQAPLPAEAPTHGDHKTRTGGWR